MFLSLAIAAVLFVGSLFAQEPIVETTFWVRGNCPTCEKRIEKTLGKIDGVQETSWDLESGDVTVTFDSTQTNQETMEKAVAAVGHATKKHEADEDAHDKLPKCCREGYKKHYD